MLITYDSRTGNVRRFVHKLDAECVQINEELLVDEPFLLVTYTTGFGQVPKKVEAFLSRNHNQLIGVAASGNRNWGHSFAGSADVIAAKYDVPVICKFELSGTERDVERFKEGAEELWQAGILN